MSAGPRAVGSRLLYPSAPDHVRAWVEATLGSPVVSYADQSGGMSPGCATRVECADGTRAFVKAVGPALNPDTPTLFRREAAVLGLLGTGPLWAALLDTYEGPEGWVALLVEDVDGRHPDLTDDATMSRLLSATDALAEVLGRYDVCSLDQGGAALNHLGERFHLWADAYDRLDDLPHDLVPGWVRDRADDLQQQMRAIADLPMDTLVHWDVRDDNLMQRPDGSIVFVDWGQAALGAPWCDPLLARLERVETPWFDEAVRSSPALTAAGDDLVTAWLCGFAVFLAHRAVTARDINLPGLVAFRRRELARALAGAARRLGETSPVVP